MSKAPLVNEIQYLLPADGLVIVGSEKVAGENASAVRDEGLREPGGADKRPDSLDACRLENHVGGGVIAAGDHGLHDSTFMNYSAEIGWIEGRTSQRPDACIKRQIVLFEFVDHVGRIQLTEALTQSKGFHRTGDEQDAIRVELDLKLGLVAHSGHQNLECLVAGQAFEHSDDVIRSSGSIESTCL